jgi:hypothetical protein
MAAPTPEQQAQAAAMLTRLFAGAGASSEQAAQAAAHYVAEASRMISSGSFAASGEVVAFSPGQARDWHGRWTGQGGLGGGDRGGEIREAGKVRKGDHIAIGGRVMRVDRVGKAPGDPQLLKMDLTSPDNENEHMYPVVHPDRTALEVIPEQPPGADTPGSFAHIRSIENLAGEIEADARGGGADSAATVTALRNVARMVGQRQIGAAKVHMDAAVKSARRAKLGFGSELKAVADSLDKIPAGTYPESGFGLRPSGPGAPPSLQPQHPGGIGYYPERAQAAAGQEHLPALVTIPGVDLLAAGTWSLSTGRQTFTAGDLTSAVEAMSCPAVGPPVIKIGHLDKRFAPGPDQDGEPTIGRVANMRIDGAKLRGDLAGMPGWLGAIAPSAYPRRSVEGKYRFRCQIGHHHPFVVTAVALLGVTPPGVGVLGELGDIAALYGVPAPAPTTASAGESWRTDPTDTEEESAVPISEEDVRRAYYAAGVPQSHWITEMQMDPTQLIVADEESGKLFRVPFSISGAAVQFGQAAPLASYADVAAGRGHGPVAVWASAEESRSVIAAWDGGAAVRALGDDPAAGAIRAMFALPGDSKTDSSLPHHDVSGGQVGAANPAGCSAAIAALNGARGGLAGVSASSKRTAYNHLAAHLREAGQDPPEFNAAGAEADDWATVEAAKKPAAPSSEDPGRPSSENPADPSSSDSPAGPHGAFTGKHSHPHTAYGEDAAAAAGGMTTKGCPPGMHAHEHTHDGDATHDHAHTSAAAAGDAPAESHDAYDGEHSHPHAAYGAQGDDQTHDHKHRHAKDAVHRHVHDPVSAAPQAAASNQGGSDVEFTDDQMAAIRQRLGKREGEPVTAADIATVFAGPKVSAAAGGEGQQPGDLPVISPGTYLVDGEVIRDWQARAAAGDHALARMRVAERDTVLAGAMTNGKFPQSRLDHYKAMWDRDPDGTRRHVEALAAGLVPVGVGPDGRPGFDAELGEFEGAQAYEALYPDDLKGGVAGAPGVPQFGELGDRQAAGRDGRR